MKAQSSARTDPPRAPRQLGSGGAAPSSTLGIPTRHGHSAGAGTRMDRELLLVFGREMLVLSVCHRLDSSALLKGGRRREKKNLRF